MVAVTFVLILSACASNDQKLVGDAMVSPLSDLNLIQVEIPPILLEARKQPYATSAEATCETLSAEIGALDVVLGADIDAPPSGADRGLAEQGADVARNAAVNTLQGAANGILPFRGWLRKLTGAERHSREVASAIVAGTVRRAFLKGVRATKSCT